MSQVWLIPCFVSSVLALLLALQCLRLQSGARTHLSRRLPQYLALSLVCFAALSLGPYYNQSTALLAPLPLRLLLYTLANLSPVSWTLLAFCLFEDKDLSSFPFWLCALCGVGTDSVDLWLSQDQPWPQGLPLIIVFEYLPQLVKLGFFTLGSYALVKSWRADLVQQRFRLRTLVFILISLIGLEMLVMENLLALSYRLPYEPQYFHILWQFALALSLFFTLTQPVLAGWTRPAQLPLERLAAPLPQTISSQAAPPWAGWVEKAQLLRELLEQQEVFRETNLNMPRLAQRLALPEYRLRELIHAELGFKNFNVFLNHYRIRAACRALRDPAQAQQAITTIALAAGFNSLAPFNRAFKEQTGQTPRAYRLNSESTAEGAAGNNSASESGGAADSRGR